MKIQIDCAVLVHSGHEAWLPPWVHLKQIMNRLSFHPLYLGQEPSVYALAEMSLLLKRYDIAVLPITIETLAWTRSALSLAQDTLTTPIFGLTNGVKPAGIQDLLSLGLAHYQVLEMGMEHTRIGIWHALNKQSRLIKQHSTLLKETDIVESYTTNSTNEVRPKSLKSIARHAVKNHKESFQSSKAKIIADFEKYYICELLESYHGNISRAARAAEKNRRAFWELMRKHKIDAEHYKKP